MTGRRRFIATAGGAMVAASAAVVDARNAIAQPMVQWWPSIACPPSLSQLHGAAQKPSQGAEGAR